VERLRDRFVDSQIRQTLSSLGRWESRNYVLEEIQEVFKEPSDIGLSAMMDQFWVAWQELSKNSSDPGRRTSVQQEAISLSSALNLAARQLHEMAQEVNSNVESALSRVNAAAQAIAVLNGEIMRARLLGDNTGDLEDQRGLLIDQLASDVDISVSVLSNGTVNIAVGGRILVSGNESRELSAQTPVQNGRIKGLLESANTLIPYYIEQLDILANSIISQVNQVHRAGFDLAGNPGGDFFEGSGAAGIRVKQEILDDPSLIAAADSPTGAGNGANALAIAQLKDMLTMNGGTATFRDFYGSMVTRLGLDTLESARSSDVYSGVLDQQTARREAISGVSIDEELLSLIRYQSAFDAASRLVNAVDEMLETLIHRTGLVGR
jgi:flagellar hook-associated protein 1 FlgK